MNNLERVTIEQVIVDEYENTDNKQRALEALSGKYQSYGYDKAEIIKLLKEKGIFKKPGRPKATLKNSEALVDTKVKDIKIVKNVENKPYSEENFVENIENTKALSDATIKCIRDAIISTKYGIDTCNKKIEDAEKYREKLYLDLEELENDLKIRGIKESEDIV